MGSTARTNLIPQLRPEMRPNERSAVLGSTDQFDPNDFRATNPRFTGENFQRNLAIADEVQAVAADVGATPAQVAIAWLLAKGDDIAPIPGTRRVARLEENVAADGVVLTADQMKRLNELTPASGGHHNEAQMEMIERLQKQTGQGSWRRITALRRTSRGGRVHGRRRR